VTPFGRADPSRIEMVKTIETLEIGALHVKDLDAERRPRDGCGKPGVHPVFGPGCDDARMRGLAGVSTSVAGWVLLLVGIVMFPLPGPGLLLIAGGLALLARRHAWAARRVERVRLQALRGAARGVSTPRRAVVTVLATVALGASGLLWLWAPPQPGWWVLPAWTWLPGGVWSGVGQVVSGLVALAVVLHSWRRYGGRPREVAEIEERLRRLDRV
jgi:hypothetical protein